MNKEKTDLKTLMDQTYQEVMVTPLGEFLKEADELGYSFFCKDIVKKVIIARLNKQGLL
jgi:hypothetical protein